MRSPRFLLVTGIFPPDSGGPATYVPRIAEFLATRGYHVDVLTLADTPKHDPAARHYGLHRLSRHAPLPLRWLRTLVALLRLGGRSDLIFAQGLAFEASLANVLLQKPFVQKVVGDLAWERSTNRGWTSDSFDQFQSRHQSMRVEMLRLVRSWWTRRADAVIVPSHYLARVVAGWGVRPERITVIPNAVEVTQVTPAPLPLSTTKNIVVVGRLVKWKGVDGAIRALAEVAETGLVIVGDGPERAELERLTVSRGLEGRVYFAGQRPRAETFALMAACDLLVLNSTYEGLPHVVLEAQVLGLPVVATAVGGTSELIQEGVNGYLVPAGDDRALSAAIRKSFESPLKGARAGVEPNLPIATWSPDRVDRAAMELLAAVLGPN